MVLDDYQSSAVAARHNVVVSAGAGSGKTRVLTERYVAIVAEGEADVSGVLALTFTRKAAAEMFRRIYTRIAERAAELDGSEGDEERVARLRRGLKMFDEARISTIDSFCAAIVRDAAARFGLPRSIDTDELRFHRAIRRHATTFLLEHGDDPALSGFLRQHGLDGTIDSLVIPVISEHIHLAQSTTFLDEHHHQIAYLRNRATQIESEVATVVARIEALEAVSSSTVAARQGVLERRGDLSALAHFLKETARRFGKKGDDPTLKEEFDTLLAKNGNSPTGLLPDWIAIGETLARSGEMRRLAELFDLLRERVVAERRRTGLLGYKDVLELAVAALASDPELRRSYAERFRYIMIDEFQDNNATQRDLLYLLAYREEYDGTVDTPDVAAIDSSKLFFVGDEKQSIYRFRGADVSVFRTLSGEIAGTLPERSDAHIELPINYRSEPSLIAFYNALFAAVFSVDAAETEAYEAVFGELAAGREAETGASGRPVTVAWVPPLDSLTPPEDETFADATLAEADWIARTIRGLLDDETYRAEEIAILLRSSAGQQKYERMLRRHGVPYQTQALRSLFSEAPAYDLYALLQLCFFPDDREALAAYLRSPLVMISDEGLVYLLTTDVDPASMPPSPFPDPDHVTDLSDDDRARLRHAIDLYERVRRSLDIVPLYEIVRIVWDEGGYRYAILHRPSDHAYLEHYDYLFSLALRYDDRSAIEFLDFLRTHLGDTAKLDDVDTSGSGNAVHVMTVHKSKGLEFPVVFVADCDRSIRRPNQIVWSDPKLGMTVKLPSSRPGESFSNVIEKHARDAEEKRELAELKRLLYVAATRAETALYFTATIRSRRETSLLSLLEPALGLNISDGTAAGCCDQFLRLEQIQPITERALRSVPIPQSVRRRRTDAVAMLEGARIVERHPRRIDVTPTALNALFRGATEVPDEQGDLFAAATGEPTGAQGDLFAAATDEPTGEPTETDATTLGTLTHRLLELRVDESAGTAIDRSAWTVEHPDASYILRTVEDTAERSRLIDESWALADAFFRSSLWREISAQRGEAEIYCEYPFLLAAGDPVVYLNGKIDLLVEAPDRVRIVDFKTDHTAEPSHYTAQMAVYRRAAEELFRKPVAVSIFYLRFGREISVDSRLEEILEAVDLSEIGPSV